MSQKTLPVLFSNNSVKNWPAKWNNFYHATHEKLDLNKRWEKFGGKIKILNVYTSSVDNLQQ